MPKHPLVETNPYLRDPAKRREMFSMTVCTSTGVEGVVLTLGELNGKALKPRESTAIRESVESSGSRR
jgi:hypothetical protein